jgi:hypothetical protein
LTKQFTWLGNINSGEHLRDNFLSTWPQYGPPSLTKRCTGNRSHNLTATLSIAENSGDDAKVQRMRATMTDGALLQTFDADDARLTGQLLPVPIETRCSTSTPPSSRKLNALLRTHGGGFNGRSSCTQQSASASSERLFCRLQRATTAKERCETVQRTDGLNSTCMPYAKPEHTWHRRLLYGLRLLGRKSGGW